MTPQLAEAAANALTVVRVAGLATVQDLGRPGFMHMGVPVGGALAPDLCARANAAVGNDLSEAVIELVGAITVRAERALTLATDDAQPRHIDAGDVLVLAPSPQVRYLAVRGGLDVPVVLGGRGTLLAATLGGHHGRVLAKGDALLVGDAPRRAPTMAAPPDPTAAVRVLAGPDVMRFSGGLAQLTDVTWHIGARRDRAGVLLAGAHVRSDLDPALVARSVSAPMVRGAIQVPPSGEPIVLGPDHPTTGGYPVIAVIATADFGSFFMRGAGVCVRFSA